MEKQLSIEEPATQLSLIMVGFLIYVSLPFVFWFWLNNELARGAFSVNADSIGIPMAGFLILWLGGLFLIPMTILLIVAVYTQLRAASEKRDS